MGKWLRRIRGAVGMGLTWAVTWFGSALVWRFVVGFPPGDDVPFPIIFGVLGFLAGATFSGVLSAVEGRRRFDEMSVPRFAALGAVSGLLFSAILGSVLGLGAELLVLGPVVTLAGAASAAGTLALAKKAEERESFATTADLAEVGLSDEETRQLLGDGDGS
jgi:hypothetical protein